jgi:Holliday junction DNA helicase RuvA
MIEYLRGTIDELTPTIAVLDLNGIGYQLFISLNTYSAIQGKKEIKLYVYEVIREDAHLLYGFAEKVERELFLQLISVSGIGGQTARMILSAFTPSELTGIIRDENVRMLKSVKGIGPKAAQRIIVDLKDKIKLDFGENPTGNATGSAVIGTVSRETIEEAVAALTMLGFPPAPTQKVVLQIVQNDASLPVEQIIKQALKML